MEILRRDENLNIILNKEQDNLNDLGWQDNMIQFEDEVLSSIINPIENYETVRFIHKPYTASVGGANLSQTDIWFNFYFLSGTTYVPDYNAIGIDTHENAKLLKATTKSFFRLEFYKTPVSGNTNEPPSRINRKLVFAKNLSIPLGEKYYFTGNNINENIHCPIFMGSNYRNKENMYLFWFQDESVLQGTVLSGNTFWMTAKFYNATDGSITDFCNDVFSTSKEVVDTTDMYFKVVIDRTDYSYQVYRFNGTTGSRIGESDDPIRFFEKGGGSLYVATPTPTQTPTPTITPTVSPTRLTNVTLTPTPTITQTQTPASRYYLLLSRCDSAPNTVTGWTMNNYLQSQCKVGDIFFSAGGFYYQVVNYDVNPHGGIIDGSKNTEGFTSCDDTPYHYVPTTYRTAYITTAWAYTGSTSYQQQLLDTCGKYPYQLSQIGYTGLTQNGSQSFYVDEASIVSGTTYQLWDSNISGGGSHVNGQNKYYSILIFGSGSNIFKYVVRISTDGVMSEWNVCP